MKIKSVLFILLLGMFSVQLMGQIRTPAPSPTVNLETRVGLTDITLNYSRPGVKDRTVFGGLVPYGQIWRTGANASTKITFSDDVKLGGKDVPAGTYAIYTIPGKESWTVMLYKDLRMGGNVSAYKEADELTRFQVDAGELPFSVESMTMDINNLRDDRADLMLYWDKTIISMPLEVEVESKVMAAIERTMAGPSANDYRAAAVYYSNNDKDLSQALEWINKALEGGERFWIVTDKARILGKLGKKAEAIKASQRAIALAKEANNNDYVKINEDLIAGWK